MLGYILAVLAACLYGVLEALKKKTTSYFSIRTIFWAITVLGLPVFAILLAIEGVPHIEPRFWWIIAIDTPLLIFTNLLFIRAEKISPISTTLPLLSLTPVFMIGTSFLFLGELPNVYGIIGIFLVVAGALFLKGEDLRKGLRLEVHSIFSEKGARYILLIAFIWSFNANFSKMAMEASSVWMYLFVGVLIEVVFMTIWMASRHREDLRAVASVNAPWLALVGLINAFTLIVFMEAINRIFVAYVITFKRVGIMVGALLFGALVFKEKNVLYRLGGGILMLLGIVLILFLH